MQWSIKMKFAPIGSPLKSAQMVFKTASFGELKGQRSYEVVKITHKSSMGKWSILNTQFMVTYMAALQYNMQSCTYFHY